MIDPRIGICVVASIVGHFVFAKALEQLPPNQQFVPSRPVEVRVVTPPPAALEPEPEPPKPEPPKPIPLPEPKPVPHERPRTEKVQEAVHEVAPVDTPPVDHAPTTSDTTTKPVFGVTLESTSQGGRGPAMPIGNTVQPGVGTAAPTKEAVKPLAAPVAAVEVTKMPLPQGRCSGKYTDAARTAAIEGVVVLDLIVDEHGRARDIKVVAGLGQGLTEAAIAALTACTFTPGEKGGQPVPVRVRGFKIRFLLQDAQ